MDLAGYVIDAVLVEKRSVREVAAAHGISKTWLYELLDRYREQGEVGLQPQSRRPRSSPTSVSAAIEDEIVALRKSLADEGLDAGAHTIHYHLLLCHRRNKEGGAVGYDDLASAVPTRPGCPPAPEAAP